MKKTLLFTLLTALMLVWSCQPKVDDAVTLTSQSEVAASVAGEVVTIAFNANVPWTAESDAAWLTLNPTSGAAGDATVKASATKNEAFDSRTATVTIKAGTASATVKVVQGQTDAIEVATADFTVAAEGGAVEIPVSANVDYQVVIPEAIDWISVAGTKAMTDSKVTLAVEPTQIYDADENGAPTFNEDAIVRTATLTIKAGSLEKQVTVAQKGLVPYFDYEGDWAGIQWSFYEGVPTIIPQEGGKITIDINSNIAWRTYFSVWSTEENAMVDSWDLGWVKLTSDETHIYLDFEANDTYFARENYLYSVGIIDGEEDGNFGGLGWFRQEGKPIEGAVTEFVWSKSLADMGITMGYNRLAYKMAGGDALLLSDGTKVHVLSPADGTYWKAITWTTVKPTSICSDDAGNVIVADDCSAANGASYTVYYAENVNEEPKPLFTHTQDFGGITIGGWRVRGDINTGAIVTGVITMDAGNPSYWGGWEIRNKQIALDNYYVQGSAGQNRGPVQGAVGSPAFGAVIALGTNANDGIFWRGYDGDNRNLYYLQTATYPNWVTPYVWDEISTAGNGGNENPNNIAVAEYNGKKVLAYTQGFHFNYSADACIYVFDVTSKDNMVPLATIVPTNDFEITNEFNWASGADVLLHPTADCLELYALNSGRSILCKYKIIF